MLIALSADLAPLALSASCFMTMIERPAEQSAATMA